MWLRDRRDALAQAGVTGEVALSVLAQWALETDTGRAEWNWNVGNIKPIPGSKEPRIDLGSAGFFRAYDSLEDGVAAYLSLVQNAHYAECWAKLEADPLSDAWVRCLGAKGYYPSSQDAYASGWNARRTSLGPAFFELQSGP